MDCGGEMKLSRYLSLQESLLLQELGPDPEFPWCFLATFWIKKMSHSGKVWDFTINIHQQW
jgi:hypothetical protein